MAPFLNRFLLLLLLHLGCFAIFSPLNQQPKNKKKNITSIFSRFFFFRKSKSDRDNIPKPNEAPVLMNSELVIHPCASRGEVLTTKPQLLDQHSSTHSSLTELAKSDTSRNIIELIFRSGWKGSNHLTVNRIFKIHHSAKTLARFEEYRGFVRSRSGGDVRCVADGNERLRFYCTTTLCADTSLQEGACGCGSPYCSTCGIVRHGFAGKSVELDGIATSGTGWGAHVSAGEEVEREFAFLHVRRAVLVCRVVAGRVARGGEHAAVLEKGFDSVVPAAKAKAKAKAGGHVEEEEELLVFNPRAVLPCFVILYSTTAA